MSWLRTSSSPDLHPTSTSSIPDDFSLEGLAANVKLLLKIIQDHGEACSKDGDDRREQRIAGMMTILDDVRARVEKWQTAGKKREAELRRCNTDLRRRNAPMEKKAAEPVADEKQKLRRDVTAALAAKKSLEMMCTSLGKEKEIMAAELARKARELSGMEELVSDLKVQNDALLTKLRACAGEHKEGGERQGSAELQERNSALSEQLLKSLDGYRSLKRKVKELQGENAGIRATMEELRAEVRSFRSRVGAGGGKGRYGEMEAEISALEQMLECFEMKVRGSMK